MDKYSGVYHDLAVFLSDDIIELIYKNMAGQQVTFPKRLYTVDYVVAMTKDIKDMTELKRCALKYNYTERRLKQLLKTNAHK
jgi:hypothetical protein